MRIGNREVPSGTTLRPDGQPGRMHPERERAYKLLDDILNHHRSIASRLLDNLHPQPQPQYGMPMDMSGAPNGGTVDQSNDFDATHTAGEVITENDETMFGDGAHFVPASVSTDFRDVEMSPIAPVEAQFKKFVFESVGGMRTDDEGRALIDHIQIDASEFPLAMLNFMTAHLPKCDWFKFCLKLCSGGLWYGLDYRLTPDQRECISQKLIRAIETRLNGVSQTPPAQPVKNDVVIDTDPPIHVNDVIFNTPQPKPQGPQAQ